MSMNTDVPKNNEPKERISDIRYFLLHSFLPVFAISVLVLVIAWQFVDPAPPKRVTIATGSETGAYFRFAQLYRQQLAQHGIDLEIKVTAGSQENLALLDAGEVELAFVQGGMTLDSKLRLRSLASVYYEPVWVFHRLDQLERLGQLSGKRLAIGGQGSGTRHLASLLLRLNGVGEADFEAIELLPDDDIPKLLKSGMVDAVFVVAGVSSPKVRELIVHPEVRLFDVDRAAAYERHEVFLSQAKLPRGVIDLAADIPAKDITLISSAANLVSNERLHPSIIDLMLMAATDVHQAGDEITPRNEFPAARDLSFPLDLDAERFHEHGTPFLMTYLPFWAASLIDRLWIMVIPMLALVIPLFKIMPPVYRWRMRSRIYRWYDELETVRKRHAVEDCEALELLHELNDIDRELARLKIPLSYAEELYNLRGHVELVRNHIERDQVAVYADTNHQRDGDD